MGSLKEFILTGLMGIALFLFALNDAWAQRAHGQGPRNRALICHHPGTPAQKTMVVDANALKGHLSHGDEEGPCGGFFDAHTHFLDEVTIGEFLSSLSNAGVTGVAIFFGPRQPFEQIGDQYAGYVFPFIQVGRRQDNTLLLDNGTAGRLRGALDTGSVYGIGELSLRHRPFPRNPAGDNNDACGDILKEVYDLAAEYGVPVNVHVEHNEFWGEFGDELECALEHNRNTNIIWAHVGDAEPEVVLGMMERHPNLYADLSARNPFFNRGIPLERQSLTHLDGPLEGKLKQGWMVVLERFPDRFLFGTDVDSVERLNIVEQVVDYFHSVLAQLTPETAEKIANGNIRRLLGLE